MNLFLKVLRILYFLLYTQMEKSMIQDLDVMRTSMGYRKTFTTSFNPGGYELRK